MANYPIATQRVSKDGKLRLTVYYEECTEHPLNTCDFPLHLDDWRRHQTINPTLHYKNGREHYDAMEDCMRHLLSLYGDKRKIQERLVRNGRKASPCECESALIWNVGRKEWLMCHYLHKRTDYRGKTHEAEWVEDYAWGMKREEIDLCYLLEDVSADTLADMINDCMTDECKVMSYTLSDNGVCFSREVGAWEHGLGWLVKSEAVGEGKWLTEEQWQGKDCYDLSEGERQEITAYCEGDVFWFRLEKAVTWKTHRECLSEEREPEDFVATEWEEIESVGGFYGLNYAIEGAKAYHELPEMVEV